MSIRITYTDATVKYGHTKLAVYQSAAQARYGTGTTPATNEPVVATKSYLSASGNGDITIDLAASNTTGQIRKPLIVVEGFDPGGNYQFRQFINSINFDENTNPEQTITLNNDLDDINQYDLIFLNYGNGTDYIQRNAYLLERVIQIVNSRKTTWNGVRQQNVIIGMSMGGLVTRYALRDMEQTGVAHETRLFISHDAPHWGANVPVGAQAAVQHLAPWKIINLGGSFPFIRWVDIFPQVVDALALFNSPAAKQMVIQRYTLSGQSLTSDNATHNAFLNEINQMGWPVNCRNVALSNGSCNGTKTFPDNSTIFTIDGAKPTTYFGSLWQSLVSTILSVSSLPTIAAPTVPLNHWAMLWQFPLSLFSTKSSIGLDFKIRAVPSSGTQEIYRGDVYSKRKILFAINVTNYFIKCHVSSTTDMLPLDNAPGGKYDINQFGIQASTIQQQLPDFFQGYVTATTLRPQFCFVPTVSSLDFVSPQQFLSSNFCNTAICNMRSGIRDYYSPPLSELHISYTQASTNWIIQRQDPNSTCVAICPSSLSIAGNVSACPTSSYSVTNLPTGSSVVWSVSPASMATVNSSTGVVTRVSNGSATLTATVSNCGVSVATSRTIQVGTPSVNISYSQSGSCNGSYQEWMLNASSPNAVSSWQWTVDNPSSGSWVVYSPSSPSTLVGVSGGGGISVTATNSCGSTKTGVTIYSNCPRIAAITASPNPTTDNVTIAAAGLKNVADDKFAKTQKAMMYEIKIIDQLGNVKKRYKYASGTSNTNISLKSFISGIYTVQAFDGTKWSSVKVIKQ